MQRSEQESKVNLTPMLDVVFIMLIFFIVTATFVTEFGIDMNPPNDRNTAPPDPKKQTILVNITANNRFLIGTHDVDVRLLRPHLQQLNAAAPKAPVIINAHSESNANALIKVMDSARAVGISNIQLADKRH